MILQPKQAKRFYRLFDELIVYTNKRLHVTQRLITPYGEIDDTETLKVVQALWDGHDNRHVIAEFVSENPAGLSRTDLREVERWEKAIYGSFAVLRHGRDTYFLYAGHAIAVRGLTREIDAALAQVPTFVETALLPFENAVIYGVSMSEYNVGIGHNIIQSIQRDFDDAMRERRDIRSASRFFQLASQLEEAEAQASAEEFAYQTELDMNVDAEVEGQHRGVLSGLSREERDKAVKSEDALRQISFDTSLIVKTLADLCFSGAPAHTLHEAFLKFNKYELQRLARTIGVSGSISAMNKRTLVEQIEERANMDKDALLKMLRVMPAQAVRDLRTLVEHGGTVAVHDDQVGRPGDIIATYFPFSLAYYRAHVFTTVMPDEVRDMLADVDWDVEVASAERIDRALTYLSHMMELRGVVYLDQALDECSECTGIDLDEDGEHLTSALFTESKMEDGSLALVPYNDDLLLFDRAMEDSLYDYAPDSQGQTDLIDGLLMLREGKPARQVPEELMEAGSVTSWLLKSDEAYALMAYLDEHVPDDKDDYYFAEDIAAELIEGSRVIDNPVEVLSGTCEFHDYAPTEAQLKRILELAAPLMNKVPKWSNNGWAPSDLAVMRA